jgi:hypothetical protein
MSSAIPQELSDHDMENCRIVSAEFLEILNEEDVINILLMTDEAHFHLLGSVNKQNFRYWAAENPHQLHQLPLHSEKVTGVGWRALG